MLQAVIEDFAYRGVILPHEPLNAKYGADHMRFADDITAANANKNIFALVGHADHFMRHYLPGGQDQIVTFIHYNPVDIALHRLLPKALRNLIKIVFGHFTNVHDIRTPVVHTHFLIGNAGEHLFPLRTGHRFMRTQGGHDIHLTAARLQNAAVFARNIAGLGMVAGKIRRKNQHFF